METQREMTNRDSPPLPLTCPGDAHHNICYCMQEMEAPSSTPAPEFKERAEGLLAGILNHPVEEQETALEQSCRDHSDIADDLRPAVELHANADSRGALVLGMGGPF